VRLLCVVRLRVGPPGNMRSTTSNGSRSATSIRRRAHQSRRRQLLATSRSLSERMRTKCDDSGSRISSKDDTVPPTTESSMCRSRIERLRL